MIEIIKRLPWLTPAVTMFWYILYGWGLNTINAPLLYWGIAMGFAIFLSMTVTYSLVASLPTVLLGSIFVMTPLALDVIVNRGNDFLVEFSYRFSNPFLFGVLAFVVAMLWFSPLFWSNRELKKSGFETKIRIGFLIGCSWLGLGLGRLLGIWY